MEILLTNLKDLSTAQITVSPRMVAEEMTPLIKVNMKLPVSDHGWHRFIARGTVYLPNECAYDDFMGDCCEHWNAPTYRDSENTPVKQLFTTIGSGCIYEQDEDNIEHRIRLTLLSH